MLISCTLVISRLFSHAAIKICDFTQCFRNLSPSHAVSEIPVHLDLYSSTFGLKSFFNLVLFLLSTAIYTIYLQVRVNPSIFHSLWITQASRDRQAWSCRKRMKGKTQNEGCTWVMKQYLFEHDCACISLHLVASAQEVPWSCKSSTTNPFAHQKAHCEHICLTETIP